MGWTEERVSLLRKLWTEGLSASQIAKQLGGVTRNAVIGKVHRLGLAGRATPSRPAKRPVRAARPRPLPGPSAPRLRTATNLPAVAGKLGQAGEFTTTARMAIPNDQPAGAYRIRYGLYRPGQGDRLSIRGLTDSGQRIRGGVMKVEKSGTAFTAGSFSVEGTDNEATALGLNASKKMLDFGPLVTDGAFRLLHPRAGLWPFSGRPAWQLIPLPGSNAFRADLRLAALEAKGAKVKAVEKVGPFCAAAKDPEWKQDGTALHLDCDGQSFAYRIVFE